MKKFIIEPVVKKADDIDSLYAVFPDANSRKRSGRVSPEYSRSETTDRVMTLIAEIGLSYIYLKTQFDDLMYRIHIVEEGESGNIPEIIQDHIVVALSFILDEENTVYYPMTNSYKELGVGISTVTYMRAKEVIDYVIANDLQEYYQDRVGVEFLATVANLKSDKFIKACKHQGADLQMGWNLDEIMSPTPKSDSNTVSSIEVEPYVDPTVAEIKRLWPLLSQEQQDAVDQAVLDHLLDLASIGVSFVVGRPEELNEKKLKTIRKILGIQNTSSSNQTAEEKPSPRTIIFDF